MAATPTPPTWFASTLTALLERRDLEGVRVCEMMQSILSGDCGEVETAALLIALSMKGESAEELAAAAAMLREHMVRLDLGRTDLLDTCGTGGDDCGTFNISTATALVVAGCGVPVVKHGNRAVSSRSGSADVLAALGVQLDCETTTARRCLNEAGMAFCLAPRFHPALRHVGPVRNRLGVRTLFNCLGPLANPARASYQLLGVGRAAWLERMAGALARLGIVRAFLVCGRDGLDEVTLTAPTLVREVLGHEIREHEWTGADFGLAPCSLTELQTATPEASAAMIRAVLAGEEGPTLRIVLANAAAALVAAERVGSLPDGVAMARESIADGCAARVLENLVRCTQAT
jgi:anthranilate phosphoribosyltransferase